MNAAINGMRLSFRGESYIFERNSVNSDLWMLDRKGEIELVFEPTPEGHKVVSVYGKYGDLVREGASGFVLYHGPNRERFAIGPVGEGFAIQQVAIKHLLDLADREEKSNA